MNILYVIDTLGVGGKERQISYLANNLGDEYSVYIIHFSDIIGFEFNHNIKLIQCSRSRKSIYYQNFLSKLIKEYKIDIIHSWDLVSSLTSIIPAKYNNIKHINGNIRGSIKHNYFSKIYILIGISFMFSDYVVANSYAGLKSKNKILNTKYRVIHNGFRIKQNSKKAVLNNDYHIGMVANVRSGKDFDMLIDASVLLLATIPLKVYIIGSGPDLPRLKEKVKEFSKNFIFTGFVNNPIDHISNLDVCLLLSKATKSHGEGISNSILEYFSLKKPVIATNSGGNNEIVKDGYNGVLVDEGNITQLVSNLNKLYLNGELRNKYGTNAFKTIKEDFSLENMINKYKLLYQE